MTTHPANRINILTSPPPNPPDKLKSEEHKSVRSPQNIERISPKMATPKQIAANRANAKKSTGPVTTEGRVKASLNSVSHGLTSGVHFLHDEDPKEFHALLADLKSEYAPATPETPRSR